MNIEKFKNPIMEYQNIAFWSWNDSIDKGEMKRQIKEMADKGWGGFFMHARVGLSIEYLSEKWFDMINFTIEEAEKNNIKAWLYDEDTYPSGFAGGLLYENEAFRSRCLALVEEDKLTDCDTVLGRHTENGIRYCICNRVMALGVPNFNGGCYIDLMNPDATQEFFNITLEAYKKNCGEKFGKEIKGIFTDEPNYLMYYFQTTPVLPWSNFLGDYFYKLKGYRIEEHLPKLFFDIEGCEKARYDLIDSALRLFLESFTKKYYKWCEDNNIQLTGHVMAEDYFEYQIQWIGAAMPHYEYMHIPGIDKLGRHVSQITTVKQCTSVAEQLGRERILSESFGCIGQHSSFKERKWITDWQAVLGINMICSHISHYSMRGDRKRDYPANLFYQQPWWSEENVFADYTARLSYAMSLGRPKIDTLVLHTISSGWCVHDPSKKRKGEPNYTCSSTQYYSESLDEVALELKQNKIDFHFGDEIIMENNAFVEDGFLHIGLYKYKTVMVPPSLTIRRNTLELFKKASRTEFIFIGGYPKMVDAVKEDISIDGARLVTNTKSGIELINRNSEINITSFYTKGNAEDIFMVIREMEGGELIFLANVSLEREVGVNINLNTNKKLYSIDLNNGRIYKCNREFDAKFHSAGSMLIYKTDDEIDCKPGPIFLASGIEFKSNLCEIERISDLKTTLLEENVLPINSASLFINGQRRTDNEHLMQVWHKHFYPSKDGTLFSTEYEFLVEKIPENECFLVIENAENLDEITLNGNKLVPLKSKGDEVLFDPDKMYKDIAFIKVPTGNNIRVGKNLIVIKGVKMNNISGLGTHFKTKNLENCPFTEVEPIYVVGDFGVKDIDGTTFVIGEQPQLQSQDITNSGAPFFAGKASFFTECSKYEGEVYLRLNQLKASDATVYVNKKRVECRYSKPLIFDLTGLLNQECNQIQIVASSTLYNLMGPNNYEDVMNLLYVGPKHFVDVKKYTESYHLLPFGLESISILKRETGEDSDSLQVL